MEWESIETAPRDGRWFVVLTPGITVGTRHGSIASPNVRIVRRHRTKSGEGDGYWQSVEGHSIADTYLGSALWSSVDALPLRELYEQAAASRNYPFPFSSMLDCVQVVENQRQS